MDRRTPQATWLLAILLLASPPLRGETVNDEPCRLDHPGLQETILGALAFLEDTQVRDRPGRGSPLRDSSEEGDGCRGRMSLNIGRCEDIGIPRCRTTHNRTGEWASHMHPLPYRLGIRGRSLVAIQDSSPFFTVSCAYALFFVDDACLPPDRRFVADMLDHAVRNVAGYKRNEAYSFWPELPGVESPMPRVGPPNIGVTRLHRLLNLRLAMQRLRDRLMPNHTTLQQRQMHQWIKTVLDRKVNPTGADAMLNGPNDADDTSLIVLLQHHYAGRYPECGVVADVPALREVVKYRDVGRDREHRRNTWKSKDSGAYLTWMKHEHEPIFARPETGVLAVGTNDVDAVVNANVACTLARLGLQNEPGYKECLALLASVVEERLWPDAGTYYPQYMIFPYVVSRAYRDGGARDGPMPAAMRTLLLQLLDEQEAWGIRHPRRRGAFPGGQDFSDHLSTALGLTTLLNLGRDLACELGEEVRYDRAVHDAVNYLICQRKPYRVVAACTRERFGPAAQHAVHWETGLFFDTGAANLHWRSNAITVAMALEALTKYALAYHTDTAPAGSRHLAVVPECHGGLGLRVVVDPPANRQR